MKGSGYPPKTFVAGFGSSPHNLNCLTNINMSNPILLTFTQIYEAQSVRQLPLSFLATMSEAIPLIYFVHNVNKYT